MATRLEDAAKIVQTVKRTGTRLQTGFNCRYAPFFVRIEEIIASGQIGEILSLEWKEVITPAHWATYCRYPSYNKRRVIGNWLLEKCCHDLDLINWFLESPCIRVASFGNRTYFKPRPGFPEHCTDGCRFEKKCLFSAYRLYPGLKNRKSKLPEYMTRCVYRTSSDLVDHQNCLLEYKNGVTACFSLVPLHQKNTRLVYICGTKATLQGSWVDNSIRIFPHHSQKEIIRDLTGSGAGHGGGDSRIISAFLDWLDNPANQPKTTEKEGWTAMLVAAGLDLALRKHKVVDLKRLQQGLRC
jgi:predicted dehydrogenase